MYIYVLLSYVIASHFLLEHKISELLIKYSYKCFFLSKVDEVTDLLANFTSLSLQNLGDR